VAVRQTDYYELLGIDPAASGDEVRSAYRRLIRVGHPDVGGTDGFARLLQEAYETLADSRQRAPYDAARSGAVREQTHRGEPGSTWPPPASRRPRRRRSRLSVGKVVRLLFMVWMLAVTAGDLVSSSYRRLGLFLTGLRAIGLLRRWRRQRRMRRLYGRQGGFLLGELVEKKCP
jgi:curved DNA-binding protein CbpA